jgi:hypothetical protein
MYSAGNHHHHQLALKSNSRAAHVDKMNQFGRLETRTSRTRNFLSPGQKLGPFLHFGYLKKRHYQEEKKKKKTRREKL